MILKTVIHHNQETSQFVADVAGKIAFLSYKPLSDGLDYYRTFVPPELRGRQIGQAIVEYALNYAKDNHLKVKPTCSFVKHYIDNHPEYRFLEYK
ncbi:MAG: N-acetyltransferase [Proteobacteria bacterium]|nr:N-acetyltransferase [Pseudomonadota bacterium]